MSAHKLVIKDALWQLFGRIISALFGFVITKIIASYLGPLRYGDYGTIFRFFAWWTALVDFGIYVLAVKRLWTLKAEIPESPENKKDQNSDFWPNSPLGSEYGKFVGTRIFLIGLIYSLAIVVAYLIPAYTSNPFIVRGLPLAMCYSASNMYAGIQQLPLQIFRKMKRLTRSLIIARLSQLIVLLPIVYYFFSSVNFTASETTTPAMVTAFALVIFSVVASSLGQNVEMHLRTKDLLPLKIRFDFSFIKDLLKNNRRYGFSYFFSSFHTLLVLMFLGRFFPTSSGFKYAGIWALSLSLIEILLIIPSSLWNSLLHKIPKYSLENKKKSLWNLMLLVGFLGLWIAINFGLFSSDIIPIVSSGEFLGSWTDITHRGSDQVLPFLWIVLFMSFVKQVYNYTFVALDQQNKLFSINATWVLIWCLIGIFLIPRYWLFGGAITQLIIETFFTGWAILIGKIKNLTPKIDRTLGFRLLLSLFISTLLGVVLQIFLSPYLNFSGLLAKLHLNFFIIAGIVNATLFALIYHPIKQVAKGLTQE